MSNVTLEKNGKQQQQAPKRDIKAEWLSKSRASILDFLSDGTALASISVGDQLKTYWIGIRQDGSWTFETSTEGNLYTIHPVKGCNCPDHKRRQRPCKHMVARQQLHDTLCSMSDPEVEAVRKVQDEQDDLADLLAYAAEALASGAVGCQCCGSVASPCIACRASLAVERLAK